MTGGHPVTGGGRAALLLVVALTLVVVAFLWSRPDGDEATPSAGPRISEPPSAARGTEMYVVSEVRRNGSIRVRHWIDSPVEVSELTMRAADPDGLPGTLEARNIVVGGDGALVARRTDVGTKTQTVRLGEPSRQIFVEYTLFGAVTEEGTVPGRALARLTALDVDFTGRRGSTRRVVDGPVEVLNVACVPRQQDATIRPCGRSVGDGAWQVDLRGKRRLDRLIAQVERPVG